MEAEAFSAVSSAFSLPSIEMIERFIVLFNLLNILNANRAMFSAIKDHNGKLLRRLLVEIKSIILQNREAQCRGDF
jgi:hypothetical protein